MGHAHLNRTLKSPDTLDSDGQADRSTLGGTQAVCLDGQPEVWFHPTGLQAEVAVVPSDLLDVARFHGIVGICGRSKLQTCVFAQGKGVIVRGDLFAGRIENAKRSVDSRTDSSAQ